LDVKIVSPPHAVLAMGVAAIQVGALLLVLGYMNRAEGAQRRRLTWLYLYIGAMCLVMTQTFTMEYNGRVMQHTAQFYLVVAIVVPMFLVGVARASDHPWGATIVAAIYTLFMLALIWILPRFHAEPKLGPVYNPVTQFTPPDFPLLLIAPAIVWDLLRRRIAHWNSWLQALASALVFLGVFAIVQWNFANFLMTPAAANAVFGTIYRDFYSGPNSYQALNRFYHRRENATLLLAITFVAAFLTSRRGITWGSWMRAVRR
jgi:hypothetical protein